MLLLGTVAIMESHHFPFDNLVTASLRSVPSAHCANKEDSEILLSTAKVLVFDCNGKSHEVRALLDCGSQSNFISSELASQLKLKVEEVNLSVISVNSSVTKCNETLEVKVQSQFTEFSMNLKVFVLNKITNNLPLRFVNRNNLKIPCNLFLADPTFNVPGAIDLLLGVNVFYDLLSIGQIRIAENMPVLQKSKLGWLISGSVSLNSPVNKIVNRNEDESVNFMQTVCSFTSNANIQRQMEQFWRLEELQPKKILKREEQECEDLFVKTTLHHAEDGKFVVELPTFKEIENIGDSREMAIKRFEKLEKRLTGNEKIKREYSDFMKEYEELGHMTEISENEIESNSPTYYMPHHPVIKETSTTTKLRVVFDASAKTTNNASLNKMLKCGPVIQDERYAILLRFREHNFVIGADIEKMYRQVWIKAEFRDLQRIVWRENPGEILKHYKLNTVTYGTTPASFLAIRSLHMSADEEQEYFPEACKEIKRNFYVDDYFSGSSTIDGAIKLKNDISKVLSKSGFNLRKWVTNNKSILEQNENTSIKHYLVEDKMSKILGIAWNVENDSLQYLVNLKDDDKCTKRSILSIISKIFDPLGLIGPIIITAKIIMQKLWSENLDWDEPVSESLLVLWRKFCQELPAVNEINIPRHVMCFKSVFTELHGLCDASERAFGACVYLRSIDENGDIKSFLLCAKSKVAPLKTLTLPRLELCGALLLTRLMNKVTESLSFNVNKVYYWTYSKIVLAWISVEAASWTVFVAHRVAEIQLNSNVSNWNHVDTVNNPADLISRGCVPEKLMNSQLWWTGPSWLSQESRTWPDGSFCSEVDIPEQRKTIQVFEYLSLEGIKWNFIPPRSPHFGGLWESHVRLAKYHLKRIVVQHFWDRWYRECFSELNKRSKWRYQNGPNVKVGDMVLLKEDNLPPLQWLMGRIEQVFPGSDNVVRVVLVKTSKGNSILLGLTPDVLKTKLLCEKHFSDDDYRTEKKHYLKLNAVPKKYFDQNEDQSNLKVQTPTKTYSMKKRTIPFESPIASKKRAFNEELEHQNSQLLEEIMDLPFGQMTPRKAKKLKFKAC
ncbi:uncharacterized protein LOC126747939 [Anthonomus grandis grandis]|uniref:uncharacterized protein LOC126747939 n=1 Tax=Anthonomus grandis grandis TaxID=2921223 RepID=UPI0021658135|nr:uncharacterized protein LOC126747939 [Anthonomus grandis grandis]